MTPDDPQPTPKETDMRDVTDEMVETMARAYVLPNRWDDMCESYRDEVRTGIRQALAARPGDDLARRVADIEEQIKPGAPQDMHYKARLQGHDGSLKELRERLDRLDDVVNQHDMSIDLMQGKCICGVFETCDCGKGLPVVQHTPPADAVPDAGRAGEDASDDLWMEVNDAFSDGYQQSPASAGVRGHCIAGAKAGVARAEALGLCRPALVEGGGDQ